MTTSQPSLLDPDKFGLLIQCRQKMDQLNTEQLQHYAKSVFTLLSDTQLKQLLFVGCNAIKNHIEFHQLFGMKSCINQIIEEINKEKALKKKSKARKIHKSSLTKSIPSDIISNNICHFLKMSSITKLAQCDRQLAIICHTPTSICNLMHRYDPYRYNPRDVFVIIMDEIQATPERTDSHFCRKRIAVLNQLLKQFAKSFNALHRNSSANSRPLVFRIHVKSCHKTREPQCKIDSGSDMDLFATTIQNLLLNYLMTYSLGKIQIKLSWNTSGWRHSLPAYDARSYLQALIRLFRIDIKQGGFVKTDTDTTLYTDQDFKQYAISASNKDIEDKNTKYHENKWKVDCRYCCNTPWM